MNSSDATTTSINTNRDFVIQVILRRYLGISRTIFSLEKLSKIA